LGNFHEFILIFTEISGKLKKIPSVHSTDLNISQSSRTCLQIQPNRFPGYFQDTLNKVPVHRPTWVL